MPKQNDLIGASMIAKVGSLFGEAVEAEVKARTKKHKQAGDSLRNELAKVKSKLESVEAEFKPMAAKASAAEKSNAELTDRVKELKLTIQALQTQNAKLAPAK